VPWVAAGGERVDVEDIVGERSRRRAAAAEKEICEADRDGFDIANGTEAPRARTKVLSRVSPARHGQEGSKRGGGCVCGGCK